MGAIAAALSCGLMLGGSFTQNYQRGYILAEGALEHLDRDAARLAFSHGEFSPDQRSAAAD